MERVLNIMTQRIEDRMDRWVLYLTIVTCALTLALAWNIYNTSSTANDVENMAIVSTKSGCAIRRIITTSTAETPAERALKTYYLSTEVDQCDDLPKMNKD